MNPATLQSVLLVRRLAVAALLCLWFVGQAAASWHSHDGSFVDERCAQCLASHVDDVLVDTGLPPVAAAIPSARATARILPEIPVSAFSLYAARAPPGRILL